MRRGRFVQARLRANALKAVQLRAGARAALTARFAELAKSVHGGKKVGQQDVAEPINELLQQARVNAENVKNSVSDHDTLWGSYLDPMYGQLREFVADSVSRCSDPDSLKRTTEFWLHEVAVEMQAQLHAIETEVGIPAYTLGNTYQVIQRQLTGR